mmetsp:Transcript_6361/g.23960  ORF Transcript_6361/g.23960 Transcript_6361/m.23960 type:complete len:90 (+) Transcript_6361:3723-3992(+)
MERMPKMNDRRNEKKDFLEKGIHEVELQYMLVVDVCCVAFLVGKQCAEKNANDAERIKWTSDQMMMGMLVGMLMGMDERMENGEWRETA